MSMAPPPGMRRIIDETLLYAPEYEAVKDNAVVNRVVPGGPSATRPGPDLRRSGLGVCRFSQLYAEGGALPSRAVSFAALFHDLALRALFCLVLR